MVTRESATLSMRSSSSEQTLEEALLRADPPVEAKWRLSWLPISRTARTCKVTFLGRGGLPKEIASQFENKVSESCQQEQVPICWGANCVYLAHSPTPMRVPHGKWEPDASADLQSLPPIWSEVGKPCSKCRCPVETVTPRAGRGCS